MVRTVIHVVQRAAKVASVIKKPERVRVLKSSQEANATRACWVIMETSADRVHTAVRMSVIDTVELANLLM
ncbi:hypothetical protein DPMN_071948 [Dreissena polymorpha]|uniref:Uncharacterized protein n=1 Tax=Dreissena polymorpha TaxID=45954 RepID=A0A9D3Z8S7_DREPO|nr:hypothetical protein DPMN_071948 [Dreissena polymorpha]